MPTGADGAGVPFHAPPRIRIAELDQLRAENARLRRIRDLTPAQARPARPGPAQTATFQTAPGVVNADSSPAAKVAFLAALFAARTDVYAVRRDDARTRTASAPTRPTEASMVLTHERPAGIGTDWAGCPVGSTDLRALIQDLQPTMSFHDDMHHPQRGGVPPTEVHCLPSLRDAAAAIAVIRVAQKQDPHSQLLSQRQTGPQECWCPDAAPCSQRAHSLDDGVLTSSLLASWHRRGPTRDGRWPVQSQR